MHTLFSRLRDLLRRVPLSPAESTVAAFVVCALAAALGLRAWSTFVAPPAHVVPADFAPLDREFVQKSRAPILPASLRDGALYSPTAAARKTAPAPHSVDLNTAPPEVLRRLPGVGPALAARIVAFRRATPFRRTAEVQRVEGIGPRKWARIEPYVTVQ